MFEQLPTDLSGIVKAYDVRGLVPEQLNEQVASALGAAFAQLCRSEAQGSEAQGSEAHHGERLAVVTAHDMRESSVPLARAFAQGVIGQGADVVEVGLASTDLLYFASGKLDLPGAMFTASHNPPQYNGVKFCRAGAAPIGQESGLAQLRAVAEELLAEFTVDTAGAAPEPNGSVGTVSQVDVLADYASHLRSLVDVRRIRPLTVVVDAGNGMAGHTVPAVLGDAVLSALPLRIIPLYFELDGSFPNHEANPLDPENLRDLQRAVREHGADIGLAFDGDADRCFVIDERGEPVSPSAITALVAVRELAKEPGAKIIHNCITSRVVPEVVAEHGGVPVRTRVGHSFIKAEMARTGAIFGGEHSAHYYFRDFWRADTGMLAALHVLAALGETDQPLSGLVSAYERYAASGEINSTVSDQAAKMKEVAVAFASRDGAVLDELDGLTVTLPDRSWFNLRPSNTEPLLRLNVEAHDVDQMAALRDEVLDMVRSGF